MVCAARVLAYDAAVEERAACAHLKRRFEAAGFRIKENQTFDEHGVWFEMDGFDAERRVGYEYVTAEAGDGWDVDGEVIAALAERRRRGEIHVLIIDEEDAPDAASLDEAIDSFLAGLPQRAPGAPAAPADAHADHTAKSEAPPAMTDAHADETVKTEVPAADADEPAAKTEAADAAAEVVDVEPIDEAEDDEEAVEIDAEPDAPSAPPPAKAPPKAPPARAAGKSAAKSTKPPPTPKGAKKKPARKPK